MKNSIGRIIILVKDYEEASAFYEMNFGFKRIFDVTTDSGQRFLHIGTDNPNEAGIWFLKAEGGEQENYIGNQTHQQPTIVIYTSALEDLYERLKRNSVKIKIEPVLASDYKFFHCFDLYGNEIIAVELKDKNSI